MAWQPQGILDPAPYTNRVLVQVEEMTPFLLGQFYQSTLPTANYVVAVVCVLIYNFAVLPFTWKALFSKFFLICLNASLLPYFFSADFPKEIAELFRGPARTSANNLSWFSVQRLKFTVFLCFLSVMRNCSNLSIDFL